MKRRTFCSHTIFCCKQLCKLFSFLLQGSDRAIIEKKNEDDEVESYQNGRFRGSSEAMWNIYQFMMHTMKPNVQRLACHLPGEQSVYVHEDEEPQAALDRKEETELTAWFKKNAADENARDKLYVDFPQHYVFNSKEKVWNDRKNNLA